MRAEGILGSASCCIVANGRPRAPKSTLLPGCVLCIRLGKLKLEPDMENGEPSWGGGNSGSMDASVSVLSRWTPTFGMLIAVESTGSAGGILGIKNSSRRFEEVELNSAGRLASMVGAVLEFGSIHRSEPKLGRFLGSLDWVCLRFWVLDLLSRTGDCSVRRGPTVWVSRRGIELSPSAAAREPEELGP